MKKKLQQVLDSNFAIYLVIALCTLFVSRWLFTEYNFFVFDDWHNLVNLPKHDYIDFLTILPTSSYCSRPVGQVIAKILLDLFGYQYLYHLGFMILIHILNACLVYTILQKLFQNKSVSIISALIFAMYPVSNMPSYWESALFDLFGTTLILLSGLFYFKLRDLKKNHKKWQPILYTTAMILLYYISLRSKEMFICFPVLIFFLHACDYVKRIRNDKKKFDWKKFAKTCTPYFIMIGVMLFYAFCIFKLNGSNEATTTESKAYYYSFNIVEIIKNYFNYLFYYFNPHSLVYGDVPSIIHFSLLYKCFILLLIMIVLGMTIYQLIHNQYHYFLAIVAYSLFIAPVLPMPNLHAIWYLYLPAIPLAFICATFIYQFLKIFIYKNKMVLASILFTAALLVFINRLDCIRNFHNWWMDFAYKEYYTFYYFDDIEDDYENIENVFVINVPDDYTTFFIEDGGIVNVAYDDYKLNVDVIHDGEYTCQDNTLVVDFNEYEFDILQAGGSCNEQTN